MNTENASCSSHKPPGSAPRIMNGFSIECILAKPDRIGGKNEWPQSTRHSVPQFPRVSGDWNNSNHQDYKDQIRSDCQSQVSRMDFHLNNSHEHLDTNPIDQQDKIMDSGTTPDSSCVNEPIVNATGSEDGDYGSEESGCE